VSLERLLLRGSFDGSLRDKDEYRSPKPLVYAVRTAADGARHRASAIFSARLHGTTRLIGTLQTDQLASARSAALFRSHPKEVARQTLSEGSAPGGSRARSGERSERTLEAPKRFRAIVASGDS
jgi:hypothetical protein